MSTVSATSSSTTAGQAKTTMTAESLLGSDFKTWLTLMTAQLRNQDPFDPVDSTEYTAQLAQFSALEQQVHTNDLLSDLITVSASNDMAGMAEWIGKEVRVVAPADYAGTPVPVHASPDPTAYRAELVVLDRYGTEVNRLMINTGESDLEWNGRDAAGHDVAWSRYSFEVESFDSDGELISTRGAEIYADVLEVQKSGDLYALMLPGGVSVGTEEISAVRSAEG
ncbi:flagellar hook capping FlgD N-terminal domain-containing protein [Tropicimonas sp. IMCC6043]|uniref:flagellar hook capping FlgD N-terminal domain-containing protein n=1 Tax=Tropicimonas sp. IMCC6043 TaxID=2510645 RepID=UPI00101D881A|nr:flagellar hook capping FlgD N-terminal domain-containing protein [Tropicimonas sp. IMCC6043]RYH09209.1 flagellar basal body rod modification protein [Tropicimonas sp. IMCC6043]